MGVEIQLFEVGARVCRLSAKGASTVIGGGSLGLQDAHDLPA
jgi:hypothetical protein